MMGLLHEHQRIDRDQYVKIHTNNYYPEHEIQFELLIRSDTLGLPYDYTSILHYKWNQGAKYNYLETISSKVYMQGIEKKY